jgi:hypothetical protein
MEVENKDLKPLSETLADTRNCLEKIYTTIISGIDRQTMKVNPELFKDVDHIKVLESLAKIRELSRRIEREINEHFFGKP